MTPASGPHTPSPDAVVPDVTPADTDAAAVHTVVRRWLDAIAACDLDGTVSAHTPEIVLFDVPGPEQGVRGLDAYRRVWPDFFAWLDAGARFELDELQVTAGGDVAFAAALVRCGTDDDLAARPDRRLRLSLGLVRDGDGWAIAHEHHSFTYE